MKPRHAAAPSPIMTTAEVAEYLQVHQRTIYRLIHKGQIPAFKVGSDYRFDSDAIEKWMADGQVKG
jgi:excisionase family DNA binding protein